jgi:hypothetical protein
MRFLCHRILRCAVAVMLMTASMTWAALAPAHAGGPAQVRTAPALPPCHHLEASASQPGLGTVALDPGCVGLCDMTDAGHFVGQTAMVISFDAARLLPAAVSSSNCSVQPTVKGQLFSRPPPLRYRGSGLYLATQRLRI